MRIGMVCPYSFEAPGGVQNHVLGLARELARMGHRPHILAPGPVMRTEPFDRLRTGPVEGQPDQPPVEFTSAGQAVAVPYNGSIARVNFGPLSATRVRRWMRAGRFDLLHIHEPITPSIALLALWAADVPVVATFHTATPRSRSMQLAGGALRASIEKIDAGIAVSESARRVVVEHLGRDAVVIPNGFGYSEYADPPPLSGNCRVATSAHGVSVPQVDSFREGGWGRARPRVTFLGRVDEPRKGLPVLLSALPAIREELGTVQVVIAGQGSIVAPADVLLLGAIPEPEKIALLSETDVFVAPHLERESFGIVLLEAMAAGAPIAAAALPAFVDLLTPVAGGEPLAELVPVGDPAALAAAVVRTVRRPRPERVARARTHARRYDWSVVGPAVEAVYRAALAAQPPLRGGSAGGESARWETTR